MAEDILRDINPNFAIPEGLVGVQEGVRDSDYDYPDVDTVIDIQSDTYDDDDSILPEAVSSYDVEAPDDISIVSQTVRTAPDGRQVIDVIIDVADVTGAIKYDVRITKA